MQAEPGEMCLEARLPKLDEASLRSRGEARRESSPRAVREHSPAHTMIWASRLQNYEAGLPQSEEGLGAQARKAGEEVVGEVRNCPRQGC